MSKASEVFPEPLGPQQTVIAPRGMSASTDFRLCCDAPRIVICGGPGSIDAFSICDSLASSALASAAAVAGFLRRAGSFCTPSARALAAASMDFRASPVCDALTRATCSGVPAATICPPPAPPSGPRSIT